MVRSQNRLVVCGLCCGLLLMLHGRDEPLAFAAGVASLAISGLLYGLVTVQAACAPLRRGVKKGAAR
jgi:hypothetical protein